MRTRLTSIIVTALLVVIPHTAQALTLIFSQNPDPFQAFEDTTGNIGFLNVTNIGPAAASITGISVGPLSHIGGEFDDQATNIILIGPNPTVASPLVVGAGGNFNIKFSWDAVDTIKDNDVDSGLWTARFLLSGLTPEDLTSGDAFLRVNDVPLPGALPLFATALGALGLLGWWRKRKSAAP
jgi:hypothetical protein